MAGSCITTGQSQQPERAYVKGVVTLGGGSSDQCLDQHLPDTELSMGWMQTTCREAARLMSAQRDEPPGPWRSLVLKWHLRVCGDCREVERQFAQVDRLAADLFAGDDGGNDPPQR
jgi:hypothetical protein